jgi:hypothetical protein
MGFAHITNFHPAGIRLFDDDEDFIVEKEGFERLLIMIKDRANTVEGIAETLDPDDVDWQAIQEELPLITQMAERYANEGYFDDAGSHLRWACRVVSDVDNQVSL